MVNAKLKANTAPLVHETVLKELSHQQGKILDIAAGSGAFLSLLNPLRFNRYACELYPRNFLLKDVPCKSVNLNQTPFPYKDQEFDMITVIEVIEHLENPWAFVRELHRLVKKEGTLIITTPNVGNWYSRLRYLFNMRFANFFDTKFNKDGFDHITPIFPETMRMLISEKFKIKHISYNRSHIPFINLNLPWKNRLLGEIVIYRLEKL
ncbi:MAG: methyltransferase domain-containing protein [Candidatus Woesearchaeota archaeon]